jgi:hypothetical protein
MNDAVRRAHEWIKLFIFSVVLLSPIIATPIEGCLAALG